MSLWSLFIALTALAVALSMRAAVWRPKDAQVSLTVDDDDEPSQPLDARELLAHLQQRIDALEGEVDDLHRLTAALQEENDILQQRIDAAQGGMRSGGSP